MLKHLLIENYALIEKLDIQLSEGLTVITGETGAGKSILLGALSLILGERADTRVLRDKNRKCIIEGSFLIEDTSLKDLFIANDLDFEAISIFRREITPGGKSRAFINDTPVNLNAMKTISGRLIDIHSQHESLLVGSSDFQFDVVDSYANKLDDVVKYKALYLDFRLQQKKLHDMEAAERAARADLDYHKFQLDELEQARLNPDEYNEMEEEIGIQKHAEDILLKLDKGLYLLRDADVNVLDTLNEIVSLVKSLSDFGSKYKELAERLESVLIETKDIASESENLKDGIVHDPQQTAQLEARFDLINKLMLKHNAGNIHQLIQTREEFRQKIDQSCSLGKSISALRENIQKQEKELETRASEISRFRAEMIPLIRHEVMEMLKNLAMPNARFQIRQDKTDTLNHRGADDLKFLFSANPGGELQEVSKVASGGEMSRFMLSIKNIISARNLLPTIIFDEIDTGISGETSTRVAMILESMAKNMQVLTITHLPQIASRGNSHLLVYKAFGKDKTNTYIKKLNSDERIAEVAKMLGGEKPTKIMLETAKELIFNQRN
jgi:DNA repair protein RecN (Recombination protein N)